MSRKAGPTQLAAIITLLLISAAIWVAVSKEIWALSANELGDFVAGFAGSLSLIWIIATIFLQKEELALQREEVSKLAVESAYQTRAMRASTRVDFASRWRDWVQYVSQYHHEKIGISANGILVDYFNNPLRRSTLLACRSRCDVEREVDSEHKLIRCSVISYSLLPSVEGSYQYADILLRSHFEKFHENGQPTFLDKDEVDVWSDIRIDLQDLSIRNLFDETELSRRELSRISRDAVDLDMKHILVDQFFLFPEDTLFEETSRFIMRVLLNDLVRCEVELRESVAV